MVQFKVQGSKFKVTKPGGLHCLHFPYNFIFHGKRETEKPPYRQAGLGMSPPPFWASSSLNSSGVYWWPQPGQPISTPCQVGRTMIFALRQ
jgi:hypothetical protein